MNEAPTQPPVEFCEWDGNGCSLITLVNAMLEESGIHDRKFIATPIEADKFKLSLKFRKTTT